MNSKSLIAISVPWLLCGLAGIGLMATGTGCFLQCLFPPPADGEPNDVPDGAKVQNPYKTYEFDHQLHADTLAGCAVCHHLGTGNVPCSVCHWGEWLGGVPNAKEAKHMKCRVCHDVSADSRVRCDTCHTDLKRLPTADPDTDADDGDGDVTPPSDGDGDADGDVTPPSDGDGAQVDGAALFASDCAACHGADGASGFAPDIPLSTEAELTTGLESAVHGSISLTAEEIAAIADFLGG